MKKKKGVTLIELIAAMAIGAIVVVAVSSFFISYSKINNQTQKITLDENNYNIAYSQIMNITYRKDLTIKTGKSISDNENNVKEILLVKSQDSSNGELIGSENINGENLIYVFNNVNLQNYKEGNLSYGSKSIISNNIAKLNFTEVNKNLVMANVITNEEGLNKDYTFTIMAANVENDATSGNIENENPNLHIYNGEKYGWIPYSDGIVQIYIPKGATIKEEDIIWGYSSIGLVYAKKAYILYTNDNKPYIKGMNTEAPFKWKLVTEEK